MLTSPRFLLPIGLLGCVIAITSVAQAQHTFSISIDAGGQYDVDGEVPRIFDPMQPIVGRPATAISTSDPMDLSLSASYVIAFGAELPLQPLFGVEYGLSRSYDGSAGNFSTLGIFAGVAASFGQSSWQPFASFRVGPTIFLASDDLTDPAQFDDFYLAGLNMIDSIDFKGRVHYGVEVGLRRGRYSLAAFFTMYGARITYFTVSEDVIPNAISYPGTFHADVKNSKYGLRAGISF